MKQKLNKQDIVELFSMVETAKENNGCVKDVFVQFAKNKNRQPNSIRNFYYTSVTQLEKNSNLCKTLKIDISKHNVKKPVQFSINEAQNLNEKIAEQTKKGMSVRKACYVLAKGNLPLMVRFQNKFRVLNKKVAENTNVINFPSKKTQKLTDDDIKSLFFGLIKLVKQSAINEISGNLKSEVEFTSDTLRKTLIEISQKNKTIIDLQKQNKNLFSKNLLLEQKIVELRTFNLKNRMPNQING